MPAIVRVLMVSLAPLVRGSFPSGRLAPVLKKLERQVENKFQVASEAIHHVMPPAAPEDSPMTAAAPATSNGMGMASSVPIMLEREALASSAQVMERYKGNVLATQKLAEKKEAAEKHTRQAASALFVAEARYTKAKQLRVQAAQVDMNVSPTGGLHDRSQKSLAAAEANVAAARDAYVAATKAAAIAGSKATAADARLAGATTQQAEDRKAMEQSQKEVEALARSIAEAAMQLRAAEGSLRTRAHSMTVHLGNAQPISRGSLRRASASRGVFYAQTDSPKELSRGSSRTLSAQLDPDAGEARVPASRQVLQAASSAGSQAEVFEAAAARAVGMQDVYEDTMKLSDSNVQRLAKEAAGHQKPGAGVGRQQKHGNLTAAVDAGTKRIHTGSTARGIAERKHRDY